MSSWSFNDGEPVAAHILSGPEPNQPAAPAEAGTSISAVRVPLADRTRDFVAAAFATEKAPSVLGKRSASIAEPVKPGQDPGKPNALGKPPLSPKYHMPARSPQQALQGVAGAAGPHPLQGAPHPPQGTQQQSPLRSPDMQGIRDVAMASPTRSLASPAHTLAQLVTQKGQSPLRSPQQPSSARRGLHFR